MKSCIHTHPTHLDQRPLRPPKLNSAVLVCSSFGGLRGLRACEGPLRLFVAVPMTISAAGVSFAESSDFCHNLSAVSLTPVNNFSPVLLIPVRNNQKAKNLSPVSMIPLKNFLPVSTTPLINFLAVSATPAIREACQY